LRNKKQNKINKGASFRRLAALYDNFDSRVTVVEDNTQQEKDEEWNFLQVTLFTPGNSDDIR
jgi:uncharacterized protein YdcH (DUF465 family)